MATTAAQIAATMSSGRPGKLISAATTNATSITTQAAALMGFTAVNTNASTRYLKFYDKASAPTVGTDVPVLVVPLVQNQTVVFQPTNGMVFLLGLNLAITGGLADNDTTAVSANDVVVNYSYR